MSKYFDDAELQSYITHKAPDTLQPLNRLTKAVTKAKSFKFENIIELNENDLSNMLPDADEEMYLNFNLDNGTYEIIILDADEIPKPNLVQVTISSQFHCSDFCDYIYHNGSRKKFVFRII